MKTAEQMLAEGIRRDGRMVLLAGINNAMSAFVQTVHEEPEGDCAEILETAIAFTNALADKCIALKEESAAAYAVFLEASTEVDALEAMLADGGTEVE